MDAFGDLFLVNKKTNEIECGPFATKESAKEWWQKFHTDIDCKILWSSECTRQMLIDFEMNRKRYD